MTEAAKTRMAETNRESHTVENGSQEMTRREDMGSGMGLQETETAHKEDKDKVVRDLMRTSRIGKVKEASDPESIKEARHFRGDNEAHRTKQTHQKVRRMTTRGEPS